MADQGQFVLQRKLGLRVAWAVTAVCLWIGSLVGTFNVLLARPPHSLGVLLFVLVLSSAVCLTAAYFFWNALTTVEFRIEHGKIVRYARAFGVVGKRNFTENARFYLVRVEHFASRGPGPIHGAILAKSGRSIQWIASAQEFNGIDDAFAWIAAQPTLHARDITDRAPLNR